MIMGIVDWIVKHWLEIAVLAGLGKMMKIGHKIGAYQAVARIGQCILAIAIAAYIAPNVVRVLNDFTGIERFVQSAFLGQLNYNQIVPEATPTNDTSQLQAIQDLRTTEQIKRHLRRNNYIEFWESFGAGNFQDYVGLYISNVIINIFSFLFWLGGVGYLVHYLTKKYKLMDKVQSVAHQLFGAVTMAFMGLMGLWLIFLFILAISGTLLGKILLDFIERSYWLSALYNNNFIDFLINYSIYRMY